jgi:hypothetical protein
MIHTNSLRGLVQKNATVFSNDPAQPTVTLEIKAMVKQLVDVQPSPVISLQANPKQAAEGRVTIVNNDKTPLRILGVDSTSNSHDFSTKLRTLEEGKRYELLVKLHPQTLAGRISDSLKVRTNNKKVPEVMVSVMATVAGRVQATPQTVDFGQLNLSAMGTTPKEANQLIRSIMLRSQEKDFKVLNVKSTISYIKPEMIPPAREGIGYRIKVSLLREKAKKGKIDGAIVIATNDKEFSELKIPVKGQIN